MRIIWTIVILMIFILINIALLIQFFLYKYITYPRFIKFFKNEISFKVHVFVPCKGWNKESNPESCKGVGNSRSEG